MEQLYFLSHSPGDAFNKYGYYKDEMKLVRTAILAKSGHYSNVCQEGRTTWVVRCTCSVRSLLSLTAVAYTELQGFNYIKCLLELPASHSKVPHLISSGFTFL